MTQHQCLGNRGDEIERLSKAALNFETLNISVKNLRTVLSLLKCEESEVVTSTLSALSKFVGISPEHAGVLFNYHIFDDLIPLVGYEDVIIRRCATKLLHLMTSSDDVQNYLINTSEKNYIHCFMNVLVDESDTIVQKNLLRILSKCSDHTFGASHVLECPHLNFFLNNLQTPDGDIREIILNMLYKLIVNPTAVDRIYSLKEFSFDLFYDLLDDEDEYIQSTTLTLLEYFLMNREDNEKHRAFCNSGGLQKILRLFYENRWEHGDPPVFNLLSIATENYETAKYFQSLIGHPEISEFLKIIYDSANAMVIQLMSNLSIIPDFRKILCDSGIIRWIIENLNSELDSDLINPICSMISNICIVRKAMDEFVNGNIVDHLIEILKNEQINWEIKEDTLVAVNNMVSYDNHNGEIIINHEDHLSLMERVLKDNTPMSIQLGFLNIFDTLIKVPQFRSAFIRLSVLQMLSNFFNKDIAEEVKIASCLTLSHLFIEQRARNMCLATNFIEKLCTLICSEQSLPVRLQGIQLVQQMCCEERFIDEFVKAGLLKILFQERKVMRNAIPSWETCLETVLSGHLPLKFAVLGHLSLRDITKNAFYAMQHVCSFVSLDHLLRCVCSPVEYYYVINFSRHGIDLNSDTETLNSTYSAESFEGHYQSAVCPFLTHSIIAVDKKFCQLQPDPELCDQLDMFRRILHASESTDTYFFNSPTVVNISRIEMRAKMLAKFVAQNLSHTDSSLADDHQQCQLDNHLRELRDNLETSIIPLGKLRFGLYFERALLFKAIADQIALPASLIRGEYRKSWIEIACPQIHQTATKNYLPTKLLRPNFIVDLMDNPGELIPINSIKARRYLEYESNVKHSIA